MKKITDRIFYVGVNDRVTHLFERLWSLRRGGSYNSYVIADEKIAVVDTVEVAYASAFMQNIEKAAGGRPVDYLIVNHMEPDHSGSIAALRQRYPQMQIVGNAKTLQMIKGYYGICENLLEVSDGSTLSLGSETLTFYLAPMVHWPEVMMTYEKKDGILFSADAFGCFGALNGAIFADEVDFDRDYLDEARRYYTNIVGKYGSMVTSALKKASAFDIKMICSLHGFVWRKNIGYFIEKYMKWATYTPEEKGVMIAYASIYGNTEIMGKLSRYQILCLFLS